MQLPEVQSLGPLLGDDAPGLVVSASKTSFDAEDQPSPAPAPGQPQDSMRGVIEQAMAYMQVGPARSAKRIARPCDPR
jgi:hypothetical protein